MNKYCLIFAMLLLSLVGCSENVQMGGKVVFSDTKEPLNVGMVCFQKPGFMARGEIGPDGKYTIGSTSEKNGLPPGTYQVYVSGATKSELDEKSGMSILTSLIDERMTSPAQSGLTCEVTDKARRFDFEVDRYKKSGK